MGRPNAFIQRLVDEVLALRPAVAAKVDRRPIPEGPCGARTRSGTPCRIRIVYRNGRCKYHGGLSTGPRTKEGKARARANLAKPWARLPADAG